MEGSTRTRNPSDPAPSVGILGPLHVVVGGRAERVTRPQAQLVLVRLALSAERVVETDALIDTLWGDAPPDSARKVLQKYVSELRRALGTSHLRTEALGYSLVATDVDAARFGSFVDAARAARGQGRDRRAWELLEEGMGLWRGRALAGIPETPALADEARRLEELRIGALEDQAEIGLALGKHEALIVPLQDLVARHPLRERLWAALMLALYRAGRQAEALSSYRRLRELLNDELGVGPSPDLVALEERILVHDASLRGARSGEPAGNLPLTYTTFVGRDAETASVGTLLSKERLVSIVGPGGAGKTRLALEVGAALKNVMRDGVWFVDLASVTEPELIPATVAGVVGIAPEPDVALTRTLMDFLATREMLLLLDNCEHLGTAPAAFVAELLRSARGVVVLTTSREPLGLAGETLVPLAPLTLPPKGEADVAVLAQVDSVRLFVDRATAADPGFSLDTGIAALIADICRQLEGIPLAIELAARQLHVMGADEMFRSLTDRLSILVAPGEPDERHRTMHAAIEWSFRMLDREQQELLVALSVFPGSFTAGAAASVCRHTGLGLQDDALALAELIRRSMVVRVADADPTRYRLLQPIRSFARERASDVGLSEKLPRAHALWVAGFMSEHREVYGSDEARELARLIEEHHHLPAALRWAADNEPALAVEILDDAAELIQLEDHHMGWIGDLFGQLEAGDQGDRLKAAVLAHGAFFLADTAPDYRIALRWAEDAIRAAEKSGDPDLQTRAQLAYGLTARSTGRLDAARAALLSALETTDAPGRERWAARTRHVLAQLELVSGNYDRAIELCSESARIWDGLGSRWGAGRALWLTAASLALRGDHGDSEAVARRARGLLADHGNPSMLVHLLAVEGDAARLGGHLERAEEIYRECLTAFQAVGDRRCTASSLKNLGVVALHLGRAEEAQHLLMAALERRLRLGDEGGLAECLEGLAFVAQGRDEASNAVPLLAAASRARDRTGVAAPAVERKAVEALTTALRASLSEEAFRSAWDVGLELPIEKVVAVASRSSTHLTSP